MGSFLEVPSTDLVEFLSSDDKKWNIVYWALLKTAEQLAKIFLGNMIKCIYHMLRLK